MANNRIYYACHSIGISPFQTTPAWVALRGVQTLGINTKFNIKNIFEISQLAVYQSVEDIPDVEVTLEKVLDGYCPIYLYVTQGATTADIAGRSNRRCSLALSIYGDNVSLASGAPTKQATLSGLYVSQVSYTATVGDNVKESVTLVGNHKVWSTGGFTFSGFTSAHGVTSLSPSAASGVQQRQDFVMAKCRFPNDIPGISSNLNPEITGADGSNQFTASIQSVSVSANFGREQMLELGRRAPYHRYVAYPVEVSTSIDIISKQGDLVSCTEEGLYAGNYNVTEQTMRFKWNDSLAIDLGAKNILNGVTYGGADAGSGNATDTFSYTNQNEMAVYHTNDPSSIAVPSW